MLTVFFGPAGVTSWDDAVTLDRSRFGAFFRSAYDRGVLLPPSPFEAWFLMDAHAATVDRAGDALVAAMGDVA
jgi:glutamate-1-semialdehyde 2,1-aminomutase